MNLPVQETQFKSLVQEDSTCQWEIKSCPQLLSSQNERKLVHSNKDTAQSKNKLIDFKKESQEEDVSSRRDIKKGHTADPPVTKD